MYDEGQEWKAPQSLTRKYQNWKEELKKKDEKEEKNIPKSKIIRKRRLWHQKDRRKINEFNTIEKRVRRNLKRRRNGKEIDSKKRLGEWIERNPSCLKLFEKEYLLRLLPRNL